MWLIIHAGIKVFHVSKMDPRGWSICTLWMANEGAKNMVYQAYVCYKQNINYVRLPMKEFWPVGIYAANTYGNKMPM